MSRTLIIPAAKNIREDLQDMFGDVPSVLIPLNGIPFIETILEKWGKLYSRIIVIVNPRHKDLLAPYKIDDILVINNSTSLSDTLLTLSSIPLSGHQADILFGDSLFNSPASADTVYFSCVNPEDYRWTKFEFSGDRILDIQDKEVCTYDQAFCGYFSFSYFPGFLSLLREYKDFYKALQEYSFDRGLSFSAIKESDWIDVGHMDKYQNYKAAIIEARFFNQIQIDENTGTLTKLSTETKKLRDEANWYKQIPEKLQYLVPHIFQVSKGRIDMQYYPLPTVHELMLNGKLTLTVIQTLEKHLRNLWRFTATNTCDTACLRKKMYVQKTVERLGKIPETILADLNNVFPVSILMENIGMFVEQFNLDKPTLFTVVHGDFCASNILYDTKTNLIKLIDPRGSFETVGIFGDPLYDLAKLFHSFEGRYDFIIGDKFEIQERKVKFNISQKVRDQLSCSLQYLYEIFSSDIEQVKLIEALLFLSMIPLHSDYPERQRAMYRVGISLLEELNLVEGHCVKLL
jgi:thiamine kinase-like enzyme